MTSNYHSATSPGWAPVCRLSREEAVKPLYSVSRLIMSVRSWELRRVYKDLNCLLTILLIKKPLTAGYHSVRELAPRPWAAGSNPSKVQIVLSGLKHFSNHCNWAVITDHFYRLSSLLPKEEISMVTLISIAPSTIVAFVHKLIYSNDFFIIEFVELKFYYRFYKTLSSNTWLLSTYKSIFENYVVTSNGNKLQSVQFNLKLA